MPSTRLLRTGPVARRTVAPLSPFRKAAPRIPRETRVSVNAEHVPDNSVHTPTVARRDALAAVAAVAASAAIGPRWAVAGESFVLVDESGDPIAFSDWKAMGNPALGAVTNDSVPFALVVNGDGSLKDFALQTNCSLEDCAVDWDEEAGLFVCPCCQSRYDRTTGNVLLGPAVNPLPIWKVALNSDNHVVVTEWTGSDFRTGEKAWWL